MSTQSLDCNAKPPVRQRVTPSLRVLKQLDEGFYLAKDDQGGLFVQSPGRCLVIRIKDGGYIPKSGLFMANALQMLQVNGFQILDLGTGETGILANCLKEQGAESVTACDIDSEAIAHAAKASNRSAEICWLKSDLYSDLPSQQYNLIVSNPPQMPMPHIGQPHDYGGHDGREVIMRILQGAVRRLNLNGQLAMLCFDFLGTDHSTNHQPSLIELGNELGFVGRILASQNRIIRQGGETEKNIDWIRHVYPLYGFVVNNDGEKKYQLQILHFQKRTD